MLARAGTHVDHIVGGFDGFLIVFDHNHRVAQVTQVDERFQQARVIALVQADRRFIEHVHDAGEAGADLRGQPDALRFAAGQGFRRAVERKVVEADIDEEGNPRSDFLDDFFRHLRLVAGERQRIEKIAAVDQRQAADGGDGLPPDKDMARFAAQPLAVAFGAGFVIQVLGQLLAHGKRICLAVAALHAVDDALETVAAFKARAFFAQVFEFDLFLA